MPEDFDTTTTDAETDGAHERVPLKERFEHFVKFVLRRLIVLLSFGPGLLGVLWLLSRILKR